MVGSASEVWIVVAPPGSPPFLADAIVAEEDTYLVLSPYEASATLEATDDLLDAALAATPREPGTVVVKPGFPLSFLAIVHDLNQEPSWREEWVTGALAAALREAEKLELGSIALPMLGALHGSLDEGRFCELLHAVLQNTPLNNLREIWLMVRPGVAHSIFGALEGYDVDLRLTAQ
jgi:hypothetical protein